MASLRARGAIPYQPFYKPTALFLLRLLFRGLLLRLHGPRRDNAVFARVSYQLAEMLVCISDQNVDHIAGIRLRTELRQQFGEIRIAHAVDGVFAKVP